MPRYAEVLDQKRRSPLHLASAIGCTEIAREILRVDASLCLLRDKDGRNPLHIAAVKGFIQVTEDILAANPGCLKEVTTGGETVLHLTVRKNRVELLRYFLGREDIGSLLDKKDDHGRTILDLALIGNNSEIKNALISSQYVLHAGSFIGTALVDNLSKPVDMEIQSHSSSSNQTPCSSFGRRPQLSLATRESKNNLKKNNKDGLTEEEDDAIMVVISMLIAMVTYQDALKLLGLFWQDNTNGSADLSATPAPMLSLYLQLFLVANAVGFFASLNIFLLMSPAPMKHHRMQSLLMFSMRISVFYTVVSSIFRFPIGLTTLLSTPLSHYSPLALNSLVYVGLFERPRLFYMVLFSRKLLGWIRKKMSHREAV